MPIIGRMIFLQKNYTFTRVLCLIILPSNYSACYLEWQEESNTGCGQNQRRVNQRPKSLLPIYPL
jgi:hypothetical protein